MYIQVRDKQFNIDDDLKKKILEYPTPTFLSGLINFNQHGNESLKIDRDPKHFDKILELYSYPINHYCDLMLQIYKEYTPNEVVHDDEYHKNDLGCHDCFVDIDKTIGIREKYVIDNKQLIDDLTQFYRDLHFYGFLPLVSVSKKKNYSTKKCLRNIEKGLDKKGVGHLFFIEHLQYLQGCLSGSFVLQSYLDEEWNDSDGDLDIFINVNNWEKYCKDMYYHACYPTPWIENSEPNELSKYLDQYRKNGHKYNPELRYEICYDKKYIKAIYKYLFQNKKIKVKVFDDLATYGNTESKNSIYRVIKLKINDLKVDLVITRCFPQQYIQIFDLDFNKIYFDGYCIHSFDWNSIHNKQSVNKDGRIKYICNDIERYMNNLIRIKKYTGRGFYIAIDDKIVDINPNPLSFVEDYWIVEDYSIVKNSLSESEDDVDHEYD